MDSLLATALVLIVVLLGLLFSGQLIGLALASSGMFALLVLVGGGQIGMVGRLQFNIVNSFVVGAVPLFVFMGFVFIHSGIADRIYGAVTPLVSKFPGGLLHTNVVAGAVFGACCGSSIGGTAAVGSVALPQLKSRGYDRGLSYGSVAAGGSMSILIPPSVSFIIYGVFVGESIGALFIAGVVPGLLMTSLFMAYIVVRAVRNPKVAPTPQEIPGREILRGLVTVIPVFGTIFVVLGSIYLGVATPTEAASFGGVMALVNAAAYKRLTWDMIRRATTETVKVTCMVLILLVGAQFFSMGISMLRLPSTLAAWLVSLPVHPLVIVALVAVFYIVLGMFMEGMAIMLLSLPITFPIMMSLGYSPVWFGVLVTVFIQVGLLTPPVGVAIYITHKISGDTDMTTAIKGALPFAAVMLLTGILLVAFPWLATWLPSLMMGRAY